MHFMNLITDKLLLLLFGMAGMFFSEVTAEYVTAFLFAVFLSALCSVISDKRIQLVPVCIYLIPAFFYPNLLWFLPLILYDAPFLLIAVSITVLLFLGPNHLPVSETTASLAFFVRLLLVAECAAAHFFCINTERIRELHSALIRTRDDDTELQLLLEDRNRTLREKQDTEIYSATLKERNRIAREIHDNVGHMLTRSILLVGALRTISKEPALKQPLTNLNDTLNQAMNSIRESVHDLHDSSVSLKDSLQSLVDEFTFCPARLEYDMSPELPSELRYSFIAIVKEALVNTAKHSNATSVTISAYEHPGFYQLVIRDNGQGNDEFKGSRAQNMSDRMRTGNKSSGIGLKNMYSRVQALKGTIQITSENGFRIYITVPKEM